ncbi:MAG: hypothetical protein ACI9ON_003935 [Limisphaerales bacterium]|jgi:hypothetical protein
MPLEQLANVAEVLGMFVVAITLIFLTVQMRQSTRATRSASAIQSTSTVTAWYREVGNSEQSCALMYNALADPEARTPEEWIQFVFIFHGLLLAFQNSYYLVKEGTLDERINDSFTEVLVSISDQPGFLQYWRQRRSLFLPEFQDYVNATISSGSGGSEGIFSNINKTDAQEVDGGSLA